MARSKNLFSKMILGASLLHGKGVMAVKKLDIVIRPGREEDVRRLLDGYGVPGMTVTHVLGFGEQRGHREMYRGTAVEADLLPKVRFEVVLEEERVESLVALLVERLSTGTVGDGRIFVSDVLQAIRIRTGERTT